MNPFVTSPKRTPRETFDVAIVGAGIIGATIAVSLARTGLDVVVIDANRTPGFGSTSSSAGIVRVHAFDVESSAMAAESIAAWTTWREFTSTPVDEAVADFVRCGTFVFDDGTDALERLADTMTRAAVDFDEVDGDSLARALPWADTRRFGPPASIEDPAFWREPSERIERALHTPSSGYVSDPALAAQNLAALARRLGVRFELGRRVTGFAEQGGGVTRIDLHDGGHLDAAAVVNAAGPHSRTINALAGVGGDFAVGLSAHRQELHLVHLPESVSMSRDGAHIVDGDLGINFRPDGDDAVLVGGNGSPVDGVDVIDDVDSLDPSPSREAWYRHSVRTARRIPGSRISVAPSGIAGLYDVADDWLPIYDRTDRDGFYVAVGTSGNQFKTAPVVGDLMTAIVRAGLDGHDTDAAPLTHSLPLSGATISSSAFSRRRTPLLGGSRG